MLKKLTLTAAAGVLSVGLSANANAAFINGTLSFADGLNTLGNIVSDLTVFELGDPTLAFGGTGAFVGANNMVADVEDLDTSSPAGIDIFAVDGFTFTLSSVALDERDPPNCAGGSCTDRIEFDMTGTVSGNGFETTAFTGNFTANGSCVQAGSSGRCQPDTQSGSWSASIVALGAEVPVPVPGTLGLIGIGLLGLRLARRRRA